MIDFGCNQLRYFKISEKKKKKKKEGKQSSADININTKSLSHSHKSNMHRKQYKIFDMLFYFLSFQFAQHCQQKTELSKPKKNKNIVNNEIQTKHSKVIVQ
eukprot:TRINITY_DN3639_c0_g1_i5.p2 TRINITY_DN3639_c0_g1~~TRINITY_DN3639_c0_g1_i5.p2  ORF type:complete len:101 (+),score=9.92 TRINITY_DN3639_c0_g1_i5:733-1035(+)